MNISIPKNISDVVIVSDTWTNYKKNGGFSSVEVELRLDDLHLHKTCKSSDYGILKTKIESTLLSWSDKWSKHLQKLELEKTEALTNQLNDELVEKKKALLGILKHTIDIDDTVDWETLKNKGKFRINKVELYYDQNVRDFIAHKKSGEPKNYTEKDKRKEPTIEEFKKSLNWFKKTFFKSKVKEEFESFVKNWKLECDEIDVENQNRKLIFDKVTSAWKEKEKVFLENQKKTNQAVDDEKTRYLSGEGTAIEEYCDLVLSNSVYPDFMSMSWSVNFNDDTNTLNINYELPSSEDLPLTDSFKFVKSKNEIEKKVLTKAKKKELYDDVLYQICVRSIHEVLEADVVDKIKNVVFNGAVTSLNEGTGNIEFNVIMSVMASKGEFMKLNLNKVVAQKTFELFNGVAGKSLIDLVPVTPLSDFDSGKRVA